MENLTTLIQLALNITPLATDGLFALPNDSSLYRYHDAWWVVQSAYPVYLWRVSNGSVMNRNIPCIRSQSLKNYHLNRTAQRTLEIYSATNRSTGGNSTGVEINEILSANISLDASERLILGVNVTSTQVLPTVGRNEPQNINDYEFLVLYGSNRCLLLAEKPTSENSSCPGHDGNSLRCSLWFPNNTANVPLPQCCEFLFNILCEEGVDVFQPSCRLKKEIF
uniref:Putative group iii salivary lipocalin n=1 Tax=Rhipicephalus pulchellus TaxID=72859 RepID=L7M8L5_RHIPC